MFAVVPEDPSLAAAPALRRCVDQVCEDLTRAGLGRLPPLAGVAPIVVVRWLYRAALERASRWFPLVHVEPARVPDPSWWEDVGLLSAGGWLFVGVGDAPALPGTRIVSVEGRTVDVPPAIAARLAQLDRFHGVAVDPALADLRRSLVSQCRGATPVHLAGPTGTGKTSLAGWAHARLDNRPLSRIHRGGPSRPAPGTWSVFEEVAELEPDALAVLRERLAALEDVAPAPAERLERIERPVAPAFEALVGTSPGLVEVLARAARLADRPSNVLILGEPGVGKELLARAIHDASGRTGAYVALDLAAIPDELVDSELFGHRKGAFTGADRDRLGAFRSADRGTLLLDEVGNVSPRVQAKLLRVLQERVVRPVGDDRSTPVDVRVIAATNADLAAMVSRGDFRDDLHHRLDGVSLRLPPLRERLDDLEILARTFFTEATGSPPRGAWITDEAWRVLRSHRWPGNVRELANLIRQATAEVGPGEPLDAPHLGPLAPANRRPVPLVTTSSGELPPELPRSLVQRMTAVTLRLPPLRDRGATSVRSALLSLLDGRPIRCAALSMLAERPWWGDLPELHAAMDAIRANLDAVDLAGLEGALPHLVRPAGAQPIRVLMAPVIGEDGRVTGLQEEYREGALGIGRGRSVALARTAYDRDRGDAVLRLLGTSRAAFLDLPHLDQLSRLHVLVTREGDGLVVHRVPGAGLEVLAGALPDGVLQQVAPDRPVPVGTAAEVQVRRNEAPYLQLFVFAGAVAFEQHAAAAAGRARRDVDGITFGGAPPIKGSGVWTLDDHERSVLIDLVMRFDGGDFKAHLEAELRPRTTEGGLQRLALYVLGPRPTQYCARLFEHPTNDALRDGLASALAAAPDRDPRLEALPLGIRRSIQPLLEG